jgi:hypothetical protein
VREMQYTVQDYRQWSYHLPIQHSPFRSRNGLISMNRIGISPGAKVAKAISSPLSFPLD